MDQQSYNHAMPRRAVLTVAPKQLGIRIRLARNRLKLSQAEFAERSGLPDRQAVARVEAGLRVLRATELAAAADLCGLSTDYLLSPWHLEGEADFHWHPQCRTAEAEEKDAVQRYAEHCLASYRCLTQVSGARADSLFKLRLRLSPDASAALIESSAKDLVQEMRDAWEGTGAGEKEAWPGCMIENHLGVCVFLLPDTPPRWSGYCRLPESDALFLSSDFRDDPVAARVRLFGDLFRLLCADKPGSMRRWAAAAAMQFEADESMGEERAWTAPGHAFAKALGGALKTGGLSHEQAVKASPGVKDYGAVKTLLDRFGFVDK